MNPRDGLLSQERLMGVTQVPSFDWTASEPTTFDIDPDLLVVLCSSDIY